MTRILVIEPHKLLRHAFAAALFAEHELQTVENIPDSTPDADVVIIDAAALRERGALSSLERETIQSWRVPVVWLDADDQAEAPAVDRILRAKLPLDKESLKQALLAVRAPAEPTGAETARPNGQIRNRRETRKANKSGAAGEPTDNVIELVDVVEEVAVDDGAQMDPVKKEE